MQRTLLLAKIHNCTLTGTNLEYVGSISVDQSLLDAAGIYVHEQVQVVNVNNGERLITYVISAPSQSGTIELNGAAARLGMPGDRVIIMSYGQFESEEIQSHRPTVILVDRQNRMIEAHSNNELN